ncbi:hypothetical protein ACHQM5_026679 [Ranunculus cassubicifolius]
MYWSMMMHAICWGVWTERNKRYFEGKEREEDRLICDIKELMWQWGLPESMGRKVLLEKVMCDWDRVMYE